MDEGLFAELSFGVLAIFWLFENFYLLQLQKPLLVAP